jgi:DNA-binding HxlR family transcriptional regulator
LAKDQAMPIKQLSTKASIPDLDRSYVRCAATTINILFYKKWKVHLLCAMRTGPVRLDQLARLIPGASKKVLTRHLRQLEIEGIVVRTDKSDFVLHVEYELADEPRADVVAILNQLASWAVRHLARRLNSEREFSSESGGVRPVIEAWRKLSKDSSPEALMFPTFGRGERKGQAVPRWGENFLKWRVRPIAQKLGIPDRFVTFQVMRGPMVLTCSTMER